LGLDFGVADSQCGHFSTLGKVGASHCDLEGRSVAPVWQSVLSPVQGMVSPRRRP
jgi:hypothetical protein